MGPCRGKKYGKKEEKNKDSTTNLTKIVVRNSDKL